MSKIKNKKNDEVKNLESSDIVFTNVSHVYAPKTPYEFKSLENVNLTLSPGEIIAIIGSTGSGKSTLIQHINGLLIPTTGEVNANGFIIKAKQKKIKNVKQLRKTIGLVFQFPEYQLFEETIEKDIMFGPVHLGEKKEVAQENAKKYLEMVGLPLSYLKRSPFDLSGGQKRRVAIAGILAMEGKTLILDEPTAGLDPEGEEDFIDLFNRINKEQQKRIILVTHNMDHVLQIADEVIAMKEGKVLKVGTPFDIFRNKELLEELLIEPPKIYNLIYKLQEKGLDLTNQDIRNMAQLAAEIVKMKKK
ncbi:cobalt ABC transporter ATP-binding protein [Spiroplasma mirum ATCC 29335]|uniref:Energy-coupling factor transporter ATP-binding protein EcfA2 n=1 Tax=Spiroplasma mirum ATCC 29335 TaxID=838561 RepID=W0GQ14_9MOLU|nr:MULTISPECIES: energy-coupling factor transporter ATPase [Spiroplasma]AHF60714.1 ABC-type cobalt transport system ATP-binding protein [Spiroplasma mirum ATCC 29335]AHI57685.1 cobalt ABC transporter ATP-binding protein [Spiroplasma mirum ATCC 29335]AKM52831.1 cobalt ABC transporter ATP-binding subunit [Spiroplasma atrichopogonis]